MLKLTKKQKRELKKILEEFKPILEKYGVKVRLKPEE